jgi:hypothetical protein
MDEIKQKIETIREVIQAYDEGELSDLSTFIAVQLTINPQQPSRECILWTEKSYADIKAREKLAGIRQR